MPPVVPAGGGIGGPEQTTFQKLKMGALMGGTVGLCLGFIFGSFSILRSGAGPQGAVSQLSQTMLASATTFGLFMGVGTVIRTEGTYLEPAEVQAYRQHIMSTRVVNQLRWKKEA